MDSRRNQRRNAPRRPYGGLSPLQMVVMAAIAVAINGVLLGALLGLFEQRSEAVACAAQRAAAGNAGSLGMSRPSCWITTVAFRFSAIFRKRSSDASVSARPVLNGGTPNAS